MTTTTLMIMTTLASIASAGIPLNVVKVQAFAFSL
jgi:hypothetical protein